MKKVFASLMFACGLILSSFTVFAGNGCPGCAANVGACSGLLGALCPDTAVAAVAGTPYSQDFTVNVIPAVDAGAISPQFAGLIIPISEARISSVTGLPEGLNWQCSNDSCTYHPDTSSLASQFACFKVCGTPCGYADTFSVTVVVEFDVSIGATALTVPIPMGFVIALNSTSPNLEITAPSSFLCPSFPGDTVTLTATTGFTSYAWSTSSTANSITVTSPDTYVVTAVDNFNCAQIDTLIVGLMGSSTSITPDTTICTNTIIQLVAEGGDLFSWAPSSNLSSASVGNPVVLELQNTATYSVTVSNANCSDTASVTVTIDDADCPATCGGCTPNNTSCSAGNTIVLCEDAPDIAAGVAYDERITVYMPANIGVTNVLPIPLNITIPGLPTSAPVKEVTFDNIDGLPAGFNWECDQKGNDCTYFPGLFPAETEFGCIRICGTTCGDGGGPDSVNMELTTTVLLDLPQDVIDLIGNLQSGFDGHVTYPVPFSVYLGYSSTLAVTPAGPITASVGQTVTLDATTTGFSGHVWSNGAQGASITVNTSGTYTVQASDGTCNQTASVTVTFVTGIEEVNALASSLCVFPNPNTGYCEVSFELTEKKQVTVEVFSIEGHRVMMEVRDGSFGENVVPLNLNELAKGTYFVKLSTEDGSANTRISVY